MKHALAAFAVLSALLCFAILAYAWDIQTVSELDDLEDIVDTTWTNASPIWKIIPPGNFNYNNSLGVIAYEDGFDTNFLASLIAVTNGALIMYPLAVIETTGTTSRIRVYLSAVSTNPVGVHTTTVSIANYPDDWIDEVYGIFDGGPPSWLSGDDLAQWRSDRDPDRQHIYVDLISTNSIPDYIAMLTNAVGYYVDGTNTNSLLVVYSNDIAFVGTGIRSSGIDLYLHAPTNVSTLDLFKSTNLLETYGWTLPACLNHVVDPILWTYTGTNSPGFFAIANATIDTDGDGLADYREIRMYGTSAYLADSDGDSLSDGAEIMSYGLNALSSDSDNDGMSDGWEVANGLNPLVDDSGEDPDGDGLSNLEEYQQGTDPTKANQNDTENITGLEVYLPIE